MLRTLKRSLLMAAILATPLTALSAQDDDIQRHLTNGKIAAAQANYLESKIESSRALLDRERARFDTMRVSDMDGKIVDSMVDYIVRSLDKLEIELENSSIENGTDLTTIEDDIEKLNKLISEINS